MSNILGLSLYLSAFDNQKEMLEELKGSEYYVFTSFHIQEELNNISDYQNKAVAMCKWLKEKNFKIIGDVSPKTLKFFNYENILDFASDLNIDILRLDYGFSDDEILEIAKTHSVCFNASTIDENLVDKIINIGSKVYALHNFYPRKETGLDETLFTSINQKLVNKGIEVFAFIPGDELKRGPLYDGLPTLEKHRYMLPYISYLDLFINYGIKTIFVGDVKISKLQYQLIEDYRKDNIIKIPVNFYEDFMYLYNQEFTIRIDSPYSIMRLQESREYSCSGEKQEPFNTITRKKGFITMDNKKYQRYSGEIQIIRESLPQDDRVNVIGEINKDYLSLIYCIKNGQKIKFISI